MEVIAERILGAPASDTSEEWTSLWARRGLDLEETARAWWAYERDLTPVACGFATTGDGLVGGSPDAVASDSDGRGGAEIKCRRATSCLKAALRLEEIASPLQVQGHIWLFEADWWDVVSYSDHPKVPNVIERHAPDPVIQEALDTALARFLHVLERAERQLAALGPARIDSSDLASQLLASLTLGVEPDPDALDLDEIDELRVLLARAQTRGDMDASDASQVLDDATAGRWDSVRSIYWYLKRVEAHAVEA